MQADLLIHDAAQLITLSSPGGPKRGAGMGDLGIVPRGAVAIRDGLVLAVGPSGQLTRQVRAKHTVDASGCVVMPGFVDPHTHLVWAGARADEFEMRVTGATYMELMAAGGGIMSTVRETRAAMLDDLVDQTRPRLARALAHGTTTVEIKTGYGLNLEDELKQLAAIERLRQDFPGTLVSTFLGAHAIPAEFKGRADAYVNLVVEEMLPVVAALDPAPPFCDVFCEDGAFSLDQSRCLLQAARELGFDLKIHVDEFQPLGGTRLAVELSACAPHPTRSNCWPARTPLPWPCLERRLAWAITTIHQPAPSSTPAGR
jgi:imidazolonepropionase